MRQIWHNNANQPVSHTCTFNYHTQSLSDEILHEGLNVAVSSSILGINCLSVNDFKSNHTSVNIEYIQIPEAQVRHRQLGRIH